MKISVIIPVKNEAAGIAHLISYLKTSASSPHSFELIVVDGLSTDSTALQAEQAGATVIIASKAGRAAQMNLGANFAKNDLLYFLHADTYPPKDWDSILLNQFSNSNQAGCFRLAFDDTHPLLRFYAWFTRFDFRFVRYGDQSLFVSKKLFKKVGGFDSSLIVMEDNEIIYQLKRYTHFSILPLNVITSARKYRTNGIFRLQLIFSLIYSGYMFGVSQAVLVDLYKRHIKF